MMSAALLLRSDALVERGFFVQDVLCIKRSENRNAPFVFGDLQESALEKNRSAALPQMSLLVVC